VCCIQYYNTMQYHTGTSRAFYAFDLYINKITFLNLQMWKWKLCVLLLCFSVNLLGFLSEIFFLFNLQCIDHGAIIYVIAMISAVLNIIDHHTRLSAEQNLCMNVVIVAVWIEQHAHAPARHRVEVSQAYRRVQSYIMVGLNFFKF